MIYDCSNISYKSVMIVRKDQWVMTDVLLCPTSYRHSWLHAAMFLDVSFPLCWALQPCSTHFSGGAVSVDRLGLHRHRVAKWVHVSWSFTSSSYKLWGFDVSCPFQLSLSRSRKQKMTKVNSKKKKLLHHERFQQKKVNKSDDNSSIRIPTV